MLPKAPSFTRLSLQLVRETGVAYGDVPQLDRPATVVNFLWNHVFAAIDREAITALYLDSRCQVIGWSVPYIGILDRAAVEPRGILVPALLCNAASVIVAHNHPSGDCSPSPEDLLFSYQLAAASSLLRIQLADSLVIGEPLAPGSPPRFSRIEWPGKIAYTSDTSQKIRFARAAGLFPASMPDEQEALSRRPMVPRTYVADDSEFEAS